MTMNGGAVCYIDAIQWHANFVISRFNTSNPASVQPRHFCIPSTTSSRRAREAETPCILIDGDMVFPQTGI